MTNYYMYYDKLNDVRNWKEYKEAKKAAKRSATDKKHDQESVENAPKECIPIKFQKDNELTDKFTLEELDSLTSGYKDQYDFFKTLKEHNIYDNLFLDGIDKEFIIVYKNKGEYRKHDVIYNNSLLMSCAFEVRQEKKKHKQESEIVLTLTKELEAFIKQIKEYAVNNTEGFMQSRLVSYRLKEVLEEYIILKQNMTYQSREEYEYLNDVKNKISKYIRNYKTLRKLIVWQQKNIYNNKKNQKEEYIQQELDILEPNYNETKQNSENEINLIIGEEEGDLMKWYKIGLQENHGDKAAALDMVFRNVEDIYSYPEEELEKIGILKRKNR